MTLSSPQSKVFLAVEFSYGDPTTPSYARVANYPVNVTVDGDSYTSLMALDVELPDDRGSLIEGSATLTVPVSAHALFTALSSGEAHSPVFVTVKEVRRTPDDLTEEVFTLFVGRASKALKNFRGRRELLGIRAVGTRSRLDVPLGIQCNSQCAWTFTGNGCEISPVGLSQSGTLYSLNRFSAYITGLSQTPFFGGATTSAYWLRGYVEKDGLRILIRDWSSILPELFELARVPPASWIGQTVSVFPGCDKSLATCQNQWGNEEHFGGFGIAMPAYKPTFEDPGSP